MANIHQTIEEIAKERPDLAAQVRRYVKNHSYGLVYEQNLPDAVRLWTKEPKKFDKVHILPERGKFDTEENLKEWYVSDIVDGTATLTDGKEVKIVDVDDIVSVANYNDSIYPGLKIIDKIERGEKTDPYHMVINAENYHALEALSYAYAGKVDCIYIDPPYNSGAKDWKYNNDYVVPEDQYRHSKWLAMMERRLKLAKRLLNPEDSVMIVTIDEKEYLRLGLLLEQLFPEANIQMVSSTINPAGTGRKNELARVNEFYYFMFFGEASPLPIYTYGGDHKSVLWDVYRRSELTNVRSKTKAQFYPIFVNTKENKIIGVGEPLDNNVDISTVKAPDGCIAVFPIRDDGIETMWSCKPDEFLTRLEKGYIRLGKFNNNKPQKYSISYIKTGAISDIEKGIATIEGYAKDGSVKAFYNNTKSKIPSTVWISESYQSREYGSNIVDAFIGKGKFPFPKSLYAVEDCIKLCVANKPNALIVDFFAGSGTTAHATMLLNHLDGGHRRTILVTNNEIGPDAEKDFTKNKKLRPSDEEWQKFGIANYITWPRVKAAITGIATNGEPIKGDYKFTEEFPMSDGFKENAIFCELTYETVWDIKLDRAFNAVAPILWALAGCKGPIIEKLGKGYATTCNYAVLFKYEAVSKFVEAIKKNPSIEHVFIVTDDQQRYTNVVKRLYMINPQNIHRLYESYLKSFEIVGEGGLD